MVYTAPHVSIDAGHDGRSALNTSFFTFMIDSGTQAALVVLAIFAELESTPVEPPPLDPRTPVSLRRGSDLVPFLFRRSSAFHI